MIISVAALVSITTINIHMIDKQQYYCSYFENLSGTISMKMSAYCA